MEPNIPADRLAHAQSKVDQLLSALRGHTRQLPANADSALSFQPDADQSPEQPRELPE